MRQDANWQEEPEKCQNGVRREEGEKTGKR